MTQDEFGIEATRLHICISQAKNKYKRFVVDYFQNHAPLKVGDTVLCDGKEAIVMSVGLTKGKSFEVGVGRICLKDKNPFFNVEIPYDGVVKDGVWYPHIEDEVLHLKRGSYGEPTEEVFVNSSYKV